MLSAPRSPAAHAQVSSSGGGTQDSGGGARACQQQWRLLELDLRRLLKRLRLLELRRLPEHLRLLELRRLLQVRRLELELGRRGAMASERSTGGGMAGRSDGGVV